MTQDLPARLQNIAAKLIGQLRDQTSAPLRFVRLPGGANNQVYRVYCGDSQSCLKYYFTHPDDPRDRLAHEYHFSRYAASRRIDNIPKPLAACPSEHLALYEYIDGRRIEATELAPARIRQATEFIIALNQEPYMPEAKSLPIASEACFHWREHLAHVNRRVDGLEDIIESGSPHARAIAFVRDQLTPQWHRCCAEAEEHLEALENRPDSIPPESPRILSPSDFGFHNALINAQGDIYFLDFEYAGWDDPAKLICDFFYQPQIPVPREYLETMIDELSSLVPFEWDLESRVKALFPVYQIKWCCILLNDFLPVGNTRRRFNQADERTEERLKRQLQKAQSLLNEKRDE